MLREINQDQFKEATAKGFVLVDIYGTHCGPCQMLGQTLEALIVDYPFLEVVKLNSDNNKEFCREHKIMAVPTLFFMFDGEIKKRSTGAMSADELIEACGEYLYE